MRPVDSRATEFGGFYRRRCPGRAPAAPSRSPQEKPTATETVFRAGRSAPSISYRLLFPWCGGVPAGGFPCGTEPGSRRCRRGNPLQARPHSVPAAGLARLSGSVSPPERRRGQAPAAGAGRRSGGGGGAGSGRPERGAAAPGTARPTGTAAPAEPGEAARASAALKIRAPGALGRGKNVPATGTAPPGPVLGSPWSEKRERVMREETR